MPKVAALVPMKGHSERIPNKNLREFNGRPLCHWIINTLKYTSEVDEIVVNTDSEEIADEVGQFGVTVVERPEELQGDNVSMNKIILHDVKEVSADYYLQTHCTNPLLQSDTISGAINEYERSTSDSIFSVTPLQTRLWDSDAKPINHERDELQRTQDLEPIYEENSNLYMFTQDSVESRQNRIGNNPEMYPIKTNEAIDIDEPIDFKIAEFLHRNRYGDSPTLVEIQ